MSFKHQGYGNLSVNKNKTENKTIELVTIFKYLDETGLCTGN